MSINATSKIPTPTNTVATLSIQKTFTRADIEKQIGRKFSFKERLGWWLVKNKINSAESMEKKKMSDKTKLLILISVASLVGILISGAVGILISVIGLILLNSFGKNKNDEPQDLEYLHQNESKTKVQYLENEPKKVIIATTKEEEEMLDKKIKVERENKSNEVTKKVAIYTGIIIVGVALAAIVGALFISVFLKALLGVQ